MTESKTICDICGKVIPPFIYVSTFTIPYQTMELHLHSGDKYSCDFCTECAERFADYIEKMKDIHKKEEKDESL